MGHCSTGYIERGHPVQQLVEQALSTVTGVDLRDHPSGIDGCGIPVFAIRLQLLALAMARLVDPVDLPGDTAAACRRLTDVLAPRSHLVSGSGRIEEQLAAEANTPLIVKSGAEGVLMAALPELGLGVALKARDGASRAAGQAAWGVLDHLGTLSEPPPDQPILNKAGRQVGVRRTVLGR